MSPLTGPARALRIVPSAPSTARRYLVSIQRPDGSTDNWVRLNGNTCDHAQEAVERAGLGAVVRVVSQPLLDAA